MNLTNARILFAAQYSAPYEGNFIASLKALQERLMSDFNAKCAYVFPQSMKRQPWADKFINENIVYLTGDSSNLLEKDEFNRIVLDYKPDLIHTHFEGYDTAAVKSVNKNSRETRIVWHMHDTLGFYPSPLKALYQSYCFFKHYGVPYLTAGACVGGQSLVL